MGKWLAGIVGTVISGVLIWMITKSHEPAGKRWQNPPGPVPVKGLHNAPGPVRVPGSPFPRPSKSRSGP